MINFRSIQLLQLVFLVVRTQGWMGNSRVGATQQVALVASQLRQGRVVIIQKLVGSGSKLAMRADEELEARVAKADTARNVHQFETKERKVVFNEDVDTRAGLGFGISSSSASGATPLDSAMTSVAGVAMDQARCSRRGRRNHNDRC